MSNFSRKQKRGKKVKGLKFVPQYLISVEVDFLINNVKATILNGYQHILISNLNNINQQFLVEIYDYINETSRISEIQAILQNSHPNQMKFI